MKFSTSSLAFALSFANLGLACPEHTIVRDIAGAHLQKRADPTGPAWTYDKSYDWHVLDPKWEICQTGTQQSPIGLSLNQGLSSSHYPRFTFPEEKRFIAKGSFKNWGYGPAWDLDASLKPEQKPMMEFDDVKTYMAGWHIHSPADHSAGGDRSKAELHIVWNDANTGNARAVTGLRLDPGRMNSTFFDQFSGYPDLIPFNDTTTRKEMQLDYTSLLQDFNYFNEFWTYEGSLTSPPCTENIRWFVARNIHWMNNEQMQRILAVSKFSARPEQEIWMHRVNA